MTADAAGAHGEMFTLHGREYKYIYTTHDIQDGSEVIVERKHFEYKTGYPLPSTFYRTIVQTMKTAHGPKKILVPKPDLDFPEIPVWQLGWIFAGCDGVTRMLIKDD